MTFHQYHDALGEDRTGVMLLVKATELITTTKIEELHNVELEVEHIHHYNASPSTITIDSISSHCFLPASELDHLLLMERSFPPTRPIYIEDQPYITTHLRSMLVCRMISLHYMFQLLPETLSLAVNILDRVLTKRSVVMENELELIGVTSLLISSKFHDTYQEPQHQKLVDYLKGKMCHKFHTLQKKVTHTENDVIKMERDILTRVDYRISVPTAYTFLYMFLDATGGLAKQDIIVDASFILDCTLVIDHLLEYLPSEIASGSIVIARMANGSAPWSEDFATYTTYSTEDVMPIARSILSTISHMKDTLDLRWIDAKYGRLNSSKISKMQELYSYTQGGESIVKVGTRYNTLVGTSDSYT